MSDYKCVKSFATSIGRRYYYGEKVSSSDYNRFTYNEKSNFVLDDNYTSGSYSSSSDGNSSAPFFDSGSSFDWRSSSNDSSSSDSGNTDFGGGDFGGGGASGDW